MTLSRHDRAVEGSRSVNIVNGKSNFIYHIQQVARAFYVPYNNSFDVLRPYFELASSIISLLILVTVPAPP